MSCKDGWKAIKEGACDSTDGCELCEIGYYSNDLTDNGLTHHSNTQCEKINCDNCQISLITGATSITDGCLDCALGTIANLDQTSCDSIEILPG